MFLLRLFRVVLGLQSCTKNDLTNIIRVGWAVGLTRSGGIVSLASHEDKPSIIRTTCKVIM